MRPTFPLVFLAAVVAAASTHDTLEMSVLQSVNDGLRAELLRTGAPCAANTFSYATAGDVTHRHRNVPAARSAFQDVIDFSLVNGHRALLIRLCPGTDVVLDAPLRIGAAVVRIECSTRWERGFVAGLADYTESAGTPDPASTCVFNGGETAGPLVQVRFVASARKINLKHSAHHARLCPFFTQFTGCRRRN